MEYHSLINIKIKVIHEAFLQAFADYSIQMQPSLEAFETRLKRNGFQNLGHQKISKKQENM